MKKCMPLDIISVTNSMYYTNANSFYESTINNNQKKKKFTSHRDFSIENSELQNKNILPSFSLSGGISPQLI